MRESKGNMYDWVTSTWNPVKGRCIHDCVYCYMKGFPQKEIHLDEKVLTEDLGGGKKIFVCSGTDLFAENVPEEWIIRVLNHCKKYNNIYLFQTKNPARMIRMRDYFPETNNCIFGTTIETNRDYFISKAPTPLERTVILALPNKMVTIEPILDFDLEEFVMLIRGIKPSFVNIGADSKHHNLPEPSKEKILRLIEELSKFTNVKQKSNLKRLIE